MSPLYAREIQLQRSPDLLTGFWEKEKGTEVEREGSMRGERGQEGRKGGNEGMLQKLAYGSACGSDVDSSTTKLTLQSFRRHVDESQWRKCGVYSFSPFHVLITNRLLSVCLCAQSFNDLRNSQAGEAADWMVLLMIIIYNSMLPAASVLDCALDPSAS